MKSRNVAIIQARMGSQRFPGILRPIVFPILAMKVKVPYGGRAD